MRSVLPSLPIPIRAASDVRNPPARETRRRSGIRPAEGAAPDDLVELEHRLAELNHPPAVARPLSGSIADAADDLYALGAGIASRMGSWNRAAI